MGRIDRLLELEWMDCQGGKEAMSAPLIVPKGDDRTMTRAMYTALNKVFRKMWWEQNIDAKVEKAIMDGIIYGRGYVSVKQEEK
jgi:hypothetical protein